MNPGSTSNAIRNERTYRAISYALVFLMMGCMVMIVGNLIDTALPNWHSSMLVGILLLILIDRLYTYRQLKTLTPLSSEWLLTLGAQWIVILSFSRFLLSYADGVDSLVAELSLWARGDIASLFTPEFVITLLLAFAAWIVAAQFLELLDEIGLDMKFALHENPAYIQSNTLPAHQRLLDLILSLGIVLVILTALTRLNVRTLLTSTDGLPSVEWSYFSGAEAGALLYFVFGLALLSLSRLMSLQTHWNQLRIPVSSQHLPRQWAVYSLLFLLILAVVVSLLPAGDSLGFFSMLRTLFGFLFVVLAFVGQLIVVLALILFSLPFLLFGKAPPFIMGSTPPPMPVMPPVEPELPATSGAVWALIRSILLWGALLVLISFAFKQFVRQHDGILAALQKSRVINWLILAWQWLYKNVDTARTSVSRAITDGWQSIVARLEGKRLLPPLGLIHLRALDPRRRILFFYLAMIRRGGEQGWTRKLSQTPSEYAVHLEKVLPSASEDIDSITEAFIQARYTRQEIDVNSADRIKAIWGRIRRALQSKSQKEQFDDK
jgi:hypothetical protein